MKNYSSENYKNFEEFEKAFNKNASALLNLKVTSAKYGEGTIKEIKIKDLEHEYITVTVQHFGIYMTIEFESGTKTFDLTMAIKANSLAFDEITLLKVNELFDVLKDSEPARIAELEVEIEKEREADRKIREEQLAEIKRQKELAKFQAKKEKALAKLQKLKPENTKKLFATPMSHYEVVGWMAKHCRGIRAAMPDWMEQQFVSMFGDVERYVVDSKKKTSGGFAYQWGLGLKITFDQEIVGPLEQRATSKNKKIIDNVAFIWDLVDNYGFKFGKTQDIDAIIEEVPPQYLQDFNRGFAM